MTQTTLSKEQRRIKERRQAIERMERQKRIRRWLPWIGAAVVLVLVLAVVMWSQLRPMISGNAHLAVNQPDLDLGVQHFGTTIRASFQIRNDGDGTLDLTVPDRPTVLEGCCPNKVEIGQTRLQPGESTQLSTDLMMHEGMGGKHLFEIVVNTNDKVNPTQKLTIKSDWVP